MSRSPRVSSCCAVPLCGTQVPPVPPHGSEKAAVARLEGPVSVVLAGVVQSTWKLQYASWLAPEPSATMWLGDPAGGWADPSRSDGRRPPKLEPMLKHCCLAACPVSMLVLS